jgi:cytochrome oxidase Cu insertion factor (SCO1/SenC/PrrC family)
MGSGASTALSGALYTMLAWQLLVLVSVTAVVAPLIQRWNRGASPSRAQDGAAEPRARLVLRVSLGALWIVDGLLQAQPGMPASFIQRTLVPMLDSAPSWLAAPVDPLARLWLQHPVAADAVTVWLQIGLGIAVLVGGHGRLARLALYTSLTWALFIWVFGELLGGLADGSASWLTGAPGAALLYVVASAALLLPLSAWRSGRAAAGCRVVVGLTFVGGALLQALPQAGFWKPTGLFDTLTGVASGGIPGPFATAVLDLAAALPAHAALANAVLVAVLAVLGMGLLVGAFPRFMSVAAAVVCVLAWWFGQGFGVFGGTATDPNTAVALLVLLAAGWPRTAAESPIAAAAPGLEPAGVQAPQGRYRPVPLVAGVLATASVLLLPVVAGVGLLGPQTAEAAIGDSGGIVATSPQPAPKFSLTDQDGRPLALRDLRGKLFLVVFLDPECYDSCPLMANQLATSVRALGTAADSVAIVAVDVNPVFNRVQDTSTFTREHGLATLPEWHFVTGSVAQVGAVLAAYGQGVSVPEVGMIGHPQTVYLFGRDGHELAMLDDTANDDLTASYVQLITAELRRHL